jgi:cysteine desulfurase
MSGTFILVDWSSTPPVRRLYFDHNATTPIAREVLEVHARVVAEVFGNASSIHHEGQAAKRQLDFARAQIAARAGCSPKEIIFTSGGTEADNLAILGIAGWRPPGAHVITSAIEHPAVLAACSRLNATLIPVSSSGVINPDDVRRAIRPETALITIMHVNNEIGTVQPVAEIARVAREAGIPVHSDGVQAFGRIPIDVAQLGVDLYSMSGHKMYAPKGAGALYVRRGLEVQPLLAGGRQERGLRPGTENIPAVAAMGAAAVLPMPDHNGIAGLRDRLEQAILERVPGTFVNGSGERAPNTTNICFEGIEGEAMVIALDLRGFAVSSGSACSSGAVEPSHVLTAIGLSRQQAKSSLRFSLGRGNTAGEVDALVNAVAASAEHLRKLSPTYA